MKTIYERRIRYNGTGERLIKKALSLYAIGFYVEHKIIETGYEDLNIKVETNEGIFLFKFFAQRGPYAKTHEDAVEYVGKIAAALKAKIRCPRVFENLNATLLTTLSFNGNSYDFIVEEFIRVDKKKELNERDLADIAAFCADLHSSSYRPKDYYDEWCVLNFKKEQPKLQKYLELPDKRIIKKLAREFELVDTDNLPKAFIHADLINTNILKDQKGSVYLIDFSVAFFGPRVLDIAIIASNLTFFPNNSEKSSDFLRIFLVEYQKMVQLTEAELLILPLLIKICFAMYVLVASKEIATKKEYNDEDYFWRELGRKGLKIDHYKKVFPVEMAH